MSWYILDKLWNIVKCCLLLWTPKRHIHIWIQLIQLAKNHTLGDPGNQTTGWNSTLHADKDWILHLLLRGRIFWLLAGIMDKISAFRARWADSFLAPTQAAHFRPESKIAVFHLKLGSHEMGPKWIRPDHFCSHRTHPFIIVRSHGTAGFATDPVIDRGDQSSCFYHLSMQLKAFKMAPKNSQHEVR